MSEFGDVELDDIEQKAKAATPGPWELRVDEPHLVRHPRGAAITTEAFLFEAGDRAKPTERQLADAAFIAAANPAAVLAIVAELRRVRDIVRDRTSCFEHAGNCCAEWCAHCKAGVEWEQRAEFCLSRRSVGEQIR